MRSCNNKEGGAFKQDDFCCVAGIGEGRQVLREDSSIRYERMHNTRPCLVILTHQNLAYSVIEGFRD